MNTKLVIFGITGDLSRRKLLPALNDIVKSEEGENLSIIGVSRKEVDIPALIEGATGSTALAGRTSIFTMDLADAGAYVRLKDSIAAQDDEQVVVYLSVPPAAAADIVDFLGAAGLNTPNVKILFEKPFGFDLASAQDFIARTGRYFDEDQIYRIDHYMAKEVSSALLRLRRGADATHHHWGAESVERVTIVASEKIGIEGRAQFYEQTGALRDFIQGHLMQVLSLVLMTRPTLDEKVPVQRLKALRHIEAVDPAHSVRGQYEGYQEEVENLGSNVETFVSVELASNDPNWKGVPLRLVTGKALDEKRSYIEIQYRDGRYDVFEEDTVIPENGRALDAYERVLLEAIAGRKELFTSSDEVIRAWEILAPLQYAWSMDDAPLAQYKKGTHFSTPFEG